MGKSKVPLTLRLIPVIFPVVEKLAPPLAYKFFVTLFFRPLRYKVPTKELSILESATLWSETIAGKRIQCYGWGEKSDPAVLFVHGWAGRATQFRKIIPAFVDAGYRVLAFDGPAHGRSEGSETSLEGFRQVIEHLFNNNQKIVAAITHSFGGGATLYAVSQGLKIPTVINIGTPTVADKIINTFLSAVNGSQKSAAYLRQYVQKRTGRPFEDYTIMGFVDKIPTDLNLMVIHDKDDKEASVENAYILAKAFPTELLITEGLGHTRILRDEAVIRAAVTFTRSNSSTSRVLEHERNSD